VYPFGGVLHESIAVGAERYGEVKSSKVWCGCGSWDNKYTVPYGTYFLSIYIQHGGIFILSDVREYKVDRLSSLTTPNLFRETVLRDITKSQKQK
jgi:hypothetical protein